MEKKLRVHGLKITPQRLELAKIIMEFGHRHPSFNEVYKAVKAKQPNISRSTVLGNLKLMINLGLIGSFNFKGETHYEMNLQLHVNLAESNGSIRDIKNRTITKHLYDIARLIREGEGIQIKRMVVLAEQ
jgi:Fur family peroxide stress response transcriptional regulator